MRICNEYHMFSSLITNMKVKGRSYKRLNNSGHYMKARNSHKK